MDVAGGLFDGTRFVALHHFPLPALLLVTFVEQLTRHILGDGTAADAVQDHMVVELAGEGVDLVADCAGVARLAEPLDG